MFQCEIQFEFDGSDSHVVLGFYVAEQMEIDLQQLAWNLCGCDDFRCAEAFGNPVILSEDIKDGSANLVLSLTGDKPALIEKILDEYLDAFEDYIHDTVLELRSRTGDDYSFNLLVGGYAPLVCGMDA